MDRVGQLLARRIAVDLAARDLPRRRAHPPRDREYFEQSRKLFSAINDVKIEYNVNTAAAWNKMDERISGEAKVIPLFKRTIIVRVAAALLVGVALGFLVKFIIDPKDAEPIQYAALNKTVLDTLPDGSKVFINRNSEVSYVAHKNTRRVKLKGEAFFEVVHNEKQPFPKLLLRMW